MEQATLLGANFAKKQELVYGGSNVGLMRAVADGALNAGGQ
jgi:predicted Rossmann-fold nucleotide-binding protein